MDTALHGDVALQLQTVQSNIYLEYTTQGGAVFDSYISFNSFSVANIRSFRQFKCYTFHYHPIFINK